MYVNVCRAKGTGEVCTRVRLVHFYGLKTDTPPGVLLAAVVDIVGLGMSGL